MAEPKNPAQPRMREWPMFSRAKRARRSPKGDGRPWPTVAELVMEHVAGTPSERVAWLQHHAAAGRLDGDDPDEIAQAMTMLAMLARFSGSRPDRQARHLDELLDEGLQGTFPASDPVAVGDFTSTEAPRRPIDRAAVVPVAGMATKRKRAPTRLHR
ncbi:MAG: hypothetical protein ABWY63_09350 [Hyphomicrobiaceae bacterium]